jgi:hypothetical protein
MSTSSYYDIRRNLIDSAPFVESQVPSAAGDNNNDGGSATAAADYVDFRLAAAYRGLQSTKSQDSLSIKYRRMKCAVIVMATLMIIASMLLVGVSLAMAEHIDELGICLFISSRMRARVQPINRSVERRDVRSYVRGRGRKTDLHCRALVFATSAAR